MAENKNNNFNLLFHFFSGPIFFFGLKTAKDGCQVTCLLGKATTRGLSGACPAEWGHSGVFWSPALPHIAVSVGDGEVGGHIGTRWTNIQHQVHENGG